MSRRTVEADNRGQALCLTQQGRQALPELKAIADRNERRFFHCLDAREKVCWDHCCGSYPVLMTSGLCQLSEIVRKMRILMSKAIENLQAAQEQAMAARSKIGGFPYLAETPRRAGVSRNIWMLPACQSIYLTDQGPEVMQGEPLLSGAADNPALDQEALIRAVDVQPQNG